MGKIDKQKAGSKNKKFVPLYIKNPKDADESLKQIAEKEGKSKSEVIVEFLRGGGKFNARIEKWIQDEMQKRQLNRRDAVEALLFEALSLLERRDQSSSEKPKE